MTDQVTVPPRPPAPSAVEPRRRLHPLSPLVRGGRLALLAIAAISWQGYRDLGVQRWLIAIAGVAMVVFIASVLSYLVTGYHVVGRELRVYEGLVSRRTRAIPVDRLQSVELVQPLFARLFGLAELRLEVVGGRRTEAPLAFLRLDEATALRTRLLDLARIPAAPRPTADLAGPSATAPGIDGPQTGPPAAVVLPPGPAERLIHVVANRDLLISQLLRPQWWLLPLAVAAPVFFFARGHDLSFVAVASTITAVIGAILTPIRVLSGDWRFTLAAGTDGLRIRRGLVETRSSTVPPGRIQAVAVEWPLLWRGMGWVRASMHVAGVAANNSGQQRAGLLPVGTVTHAERVLADALPGFVLRDVVVSPVPGRAWVLAPWRRFVLGYQVGPTAFVSRDGLLTRRLTIVPYGRVQSVRLRQGPLQRLLRLATVHVDVAGASAAGASMSGIAAHRDVREARALALDLAERSRAARAAA